jgi:FixJ family two-component response regulator
MPKLSGNKLGEYISVLYPDVKILYISGYMDDDVLHNFMRSELFFLQKPFSSEQLLSKLKAVIEG